MHVKIFNLPCVVQALPPHTRTCACTYIPRVILFCSAIPGKSIQGRILTFTWTRLHDFRNVKHQGYLSLPLAQDRRFPSVAKQNSHCAATEEEGISSATCWVECSSYLPKHSNSAQHTRKGN